MLFALDMIEEIVLFVRRLSSKLDIQSKQSVIFSSVKFSRDITVQLAAGNYIFCLSVRLSVSYEK